MGKIAAVAEVDELELEAMRKEDSSWHPCKVSLSSETSTAVGLIVEFESQDSEDIIIITEEEALARLRFRSIPLQGDDCLNIKEGDIVLANHKTQYSKGLFFDAEVEKIYRIKHSKKTFCRCTFGIKWIHPDLEGGTMTVPSSSIMKMATSKIQCHPTVAAFLNSLKTLNCSSVPSFSSLIEDTCETDLPIFLERQIEEISKLAEASMKGSSEEFFFDFKRVDFMGHARGRTAVASQTSFLCKQGPHEKNISKRSTRSQSKMKLDISSKNPPSQPNPEESNQTHLSPLRARAALASLMHELTAKSELSILCVEKKGNANESQKTPKKYSSVESLDVSVASMDFDFCTQGKVSMTDNISSIEEAHTTPVTLKHLEITESLSSDRVCASNKSLQTKSSLNMLIMQEKPALEFDEPEEKRSNKRTLVCSATGKTLASPVKASRLTRSAMQKGTKKLNDGVELNSSIGDAKLIGTPTAMSRLTRSAFQKEEDKLTGEFKQGLEESKSVECLDSTKGDYVPLPKETMKKKSATFPVDSLVVDTKLIGTPTGIARLTRSAIHKEKGNLAVEFKQGMEESKSIEWSDSSKADHVPLPKETMKKKSATFPVDSFVVDTKLIGTPTGIARLTRSAIHKEKGNLAVEFKQGMEERKSVEWSDSSKADHVPLPNETRKRNAVTSAVDTEMSLPLAQERNKKQRGSSVPSVTRSKGEISGKGEGFQSAKKTCISEQKPELRSSPRFRFLPRLRSQKSSSRP